MHRLDDFMSGSLQVSCCNNFCNHFSNIRTDHMCAQEFTEFGVKDYFNKSIWCSGSFCLTTGCKWKLTNLYFIAGFFGGLFDFSLGGVFFSIGDVLSDRSIEQERLLQHATEIAAIACDRQVAEIDAVVI